MSKVIELNAYKQRKETEETIAPEEQVTICLEQPRKKDKYDLARENVDVEMALRIEKWLMEN